MKKYLSLLILCGISLSAEASRTISKLDCDDLNSGLAPVFYHDDKRTDEERRALRQYFDESQQTKTTSTPSQLIEDCLIPNIDEILNSLRAFEFIDAESQSEQAYLHTPSPELYLLYLMSRFKMHEEKPLEELLPYASRLFEELEPKHHLTALSTLHEIKDISKRQELVDTWLSIGLIGNNLTKATFLVIFSHHTKATCQRMISIMPKFKAPHFIARKVAKHLSFLDEDYWEGLSTVLAPFIEEKKPNKISDLLEIFVQTPHLKWPSLSNKLQEIAAHLEASDFVNFASYYAEINEAKMTAINKLVMRILELSNQTKLANSDFLPKIAPLNIKSISTIESDLRLGKLSLDAFFEEYHPKT
ncbi:MAG: hypothetical protein F9K49_00745 [Caedimonadaceae bacterium]|nr:MAG: hypothetical protein F9K49_00745 [Caedimonadaceae bacterium]